MTYREIPALFVLLLSYATLAAGPKTKKVACVPFIIASQKPKVTSGCYKKDGTVRISCTIGCGEVTNYPPRTLMDGCYHLPGQFCSPRQVQMNNSLDSIEYSPTQTAEDLKNCVKDRKKACDDEIADQIGDAAAVLAFCKQYIDNNIPASNVTVRCDP